MNEYGRTNTPLPLTASRSEQIFPTLTSAQIARVAKHGRTRAVRSGEILVNLHPSGSDRLVPGLGRPGNGNLSDFRACPCECCQLVRLCHFLHSVVIENATPRLFVPATTNR